MVFVFVGVGIRQILVDLCVVLLYLVVWWVLAVWVGLLRFVVFFVLAMLLASSLYFHVLLSCGCLVLRVLWLILVVCFGGYWCFAAL